MQYIVAMNSAGLDKMNGEEAAAGRPIFDPTPFIIELRLTDNDTGGLFGDRF